VIAEITPPTIAVHKNPYDVLIENAHRDGQTIRVKPITAQFFPNIAVLLSFAVVSEIIALITDIFPHVIPSVILERKITNIGNSINHNN